MRPGSKHKKTDCDSPFSFIREKEFRLFLWFAGRRSLFRVFCAWLASFSDIFTDAVADFGFFFFSVSAAFCSLRLASTFFDGLCVAFSDGARVFGRNSSITRILIGSSI